MNLGNLNDGYTVKKDRTCAVHTDYSIHEVGGAEESCPRCGGSGVIPPKAGSCPRCGGSGTIRVKK